VSSTVSEQSRPARSVHLAFGSGIEDLDCAAPSTGELFRYGRPKPETTASTGPGSP